MPLSSAGRRKIDLHQAGEPRPAAPEATTPHTHEQVFIRIVVRRIDNLARAVPQLYVLEVERCRPVRRREIGEQRGHTAWRAATEEIALRQVVAARLGRVYPGYKFGHGPRLGRAQAVRIMEDAVAELGRAQRHEQVPNSFAQVRVRPPRRRHPTRARCVPAQNKGHTRVHKVAQEGRRVGRRLGQLNDLGARAVPRLGCATGTPRPRHRLQIQRLTKGVRQWQRIGAIVGMAGRHLAALATAGNRQGGQVRADLRSNGGTRRGLRRCWPAPGQPLQANRKAAGGEETASLPGDGSTHDKCRDQRRK